MTGKIPDGIDANVLLLQNNYFLGQVPSKGFSRTQVVDFSGNLLSGPSCLSADILLLNLRDNRLSGNIPAEISSLPIRRILLLGNNNLSGLIPTHLCQLRTISITDLSNNSFFGSIPSCLSNVSFGDRGNGDTFFTMDSRFYYWYDSVKGEKAGYDFVNLLEEIYDSSSFKDSVYLENQYVLNIDFVTKNSLLSYKGSILNYMSGLDLSSNNLTGTIPRSLGNLSSIHALNLSHNHLKGHIPVSLCNLSQVESLDFSHNRLSGNIPSELVKLNFLAVFSVAHNNLSGRVPDKGQFPTFGISSYEGNPFLTGLPSEKNRTKVVESPLKSDDETEEKWIEI